jgi:hypothetical protein
VRSLLRFLALGLLGLHIAVSLVPAARAGARQMRDAFRYAGEDPAAARRRVFGEDYVAEVERIRGVLPPFAPYFLVDGGSLYEGGPFWVRFDLAPRRAYMLGPWAELPPARKLRRRLPRGPEWVVVAYGPGKAPLLIDRKTFLRRLEERDARR